MTKRRFKDILLAVLFVGSFLYFLFVALLVFIMLSEQFRTTNYTLNTTFKGTLFSPVMPIVKELVSFNQPYVIVVLSLWVMAVVCLYTLYEPFKTRLKVWISLLETRIFG